MIPVTRFANKPRLASGRRLRQSRAAVGVAIVRRIERDGSLVEGEIFERPCGVAIRLPLPGDGGL